MAMATRAAMRRSSDAVVFGVGVDARGLHVDDAHQLAARDHGDGQFGAHGVQRVQVARIVAHVAHQDRLRAMRGRAGDPFAQGDRQVADHLVAVADA